LDQPEIYAISIKANYYIFQLTRFTHKKKSREVQEFVKSTQLKDLDSLIRQGFKQLDITDYLRVIDHGYSL